MQPREQEAKMHAAFRVLLEMPEGSVKQVVDEFTRRIEAGNREEFLKSLLDKLDAAMTAAESAKES
jgi:hypothetical protein